MCQSFQSSQKAHYRWEIDDKNPIFSASRSKKLLLSGASEAFFAGGMNKNVSLCGSLMRKMFHSTMVETTPICKSN